MSESLPSPEPSPKIPDGSQPRIPKTALELWDQAQAKLAARGELETEKPEPRTPVSALELVQRTRAKLAAERAARGESAPHLDPEAWVPKPDVWLPLPEDDAPR